MDRWDDHRRVKDHGCQLASVRDCQWEEGRDCQWAKGVVVERRAAQKRQPQDGQLLADPAVAGWARLDAARVERPQYFVPLGVEAVRAEPGALASVRIAVGAETLPERADAELLELRAVRPLREWATATKQLPVQTLALTSAVQLVPKEEPTRLMPGSFESLELAEKQRPARQAWPLLAVVQERPLARRGSE